MSIVTNKEVSKALGLSKLGFLGRGVASVVMYLLGISTLNKKYDNIKHLKGDAFVDAMVKVLGIKYNIHAEDLKRIPTEGSFIAVANHPLGGIDGIILIKILSSIRPDFQIIANFLLHQIKPLKDYVIPVNPFENNKEAFDSKRGLITAFKHVANGGALAMFPAGEVSEYDKKTKETRDIEWIESGVKFIKKAKVPVIPIYFHSRNTSFFYFMAKLNATLKTALLPSEMLKKSGKSVQIRIGKPISVKQQGEYEDIKEYSSFLRKRVYMLRAFFEKKKNPFKDLEFSKAREMPKVHTDNIKPIIAETPKAKLEEEIDVLRTIDCQLFQQSNYEIFLAEPTRIPNILREIGRLREVTFREAGEGTNEEIDLDEFDQFYRHLFLWDNDKKVIVGAYRMGLGAEIYKNHGIKGFYTTTLFDFDKDLHPFFGRAIEMGRAFIIKEYQLKPMPLFLLWKGIVHVCLRNPEHKYLIGGVSISNKFSEFSKSIMIEFMRSHYFDAYVGQFVHPKNEFKVKLSKEDRAMFFEAADNDLNKFDKLIDELEPSELRLPVLIKKYFKQNARVIAFNVDPNFNDAIDGLMYIRISEIPEETIKPVLEELQNMANNPSDDEK